MVADPQSIMDIPATDRANRRVMVVGTISKSAGALDQLTDLNRFTEVNFPWKDIPEGINLFWFAFNEDGSALTGNTLIQHTWVAVTDWLED